MGDPYFIDSSGLVKRYAREAGSDWVRTVTDPQAGNRILISEITQVELVNALMKKERTGEMTADDADRAISRFLRHLHDQYHVVELRSSMISDAVRLVRSYVLRAYDAVQLAAALEADRIASPTDSSLLTFVSGDHQLNAAARSEGLAVIDPASP